MGNTSSVQIQRKNIIKDEPIFITKHMLIIKKWGNDKFICCNHAHTNVIYASKTIGNIPKHSILYLKDIKKKSLWKINHTNNYEYIVEYNKESYTISNSIIEFDKIKYNINTRCIKIIYGRFKYQFLNRQGIKIII